MSISNDRARGRIRTAGREKTGWVRKTMLALAAFALASAQISPALAYGPLGANGPRDGVSAMAYFRVPLGTPVAERDREPSFGLALKRELDFTDPSYGTLSYSDLNKVRFNMVDLRIGLDGRIDGLDIAGINALTFGGATRLGAEEQPARTRPELFWLLLAVGAGLATWGLAEIAENNETDHHHHGHHDDHHHDEVIVIVH
jgi:hypothetical protein